MRCVKTARPPAVLTALTLALGLLLGCRDHPQPDGDYLLRASAVDQDACGLAAADLSVGALRFSTHGNEVFTHLTLPALGADLAMQGLYHSGLETFLVGGDLADVVTEVRGAACTVPLLQATLEATTTFLEAQSNFFESATSEAFTGTLTIALRSPLDAACACVSTLTVEGTLQPSAAP